MPLADWSVPFYLRSKVYTNDPMPLGTDDDPLPINAPVVFPGGNIGIYRLRTDGCQLTNTVRETKDFVPQADGAILHRRFVGGMEMALTVQFWEQGDKIACNDALGEMLDTIMGYLYGLLNAGDNEGRISWLPDGANQRMLDDIRLLTYPVSTQSPGSPFELNFTLDTGVPYAEDETQISTALVAFPGVAVVNGGNRPTNPVFKIYGPYTTFTLINVTTGKQLNYDGALPGADPVIAGDYVEINVTNDTVFRNGNLNNMKPGIVMTTSEFFTLLPGTNVLTIAYGGGAGGASVVLVNSAWA